MFGFEQWDSAGSLVAEFLLSVVFVVAIVLIVKLVNKSQGPPASAKKQPSADTGLPSESGSGPVTAEPEQSVEPTASLPGRGPGS